MALRPASLLSLSAALLFAPAVAFGSRDFPEELQSAADMPCRPACTLCHADPSGGTGTVVEPFGRAMRLRGLRGKHASTIAPALAVLESDGADSDGDGMGDVAELAAGQNPNVEGDDSLCGPTYGCFRVEPRGSLEHDALVGFFTLGVLGLLWARRARSARRAKR